MWVSGLGIVWILDVGIVGLFLWGFMDVGIRFALVLLHCVISGFGDFQFFGVWENQMGGCPEDRAPGPLGGGHVVGEE